MGLKIDQVANISVYDYYKFYLRNSRFLGIIWQALSLCLALCLLIIFVSPNWIGDTLESANRGYFGLYSFCSRNQLATYYDCFGTWTNFNTMPNSISLRLACILVLVALNSVIFSLFVSILSLLIKYERIFHICAWIQFSATIFMIIAVVIYPISWDVREVRAVCGEESGQFYLGTCSLRWPFILACMCCVQLILLTLLAFLLAGRQASFILEHGSSKDRQKLQQQQQQHQQQLQSLNYNDVNPSTSDRVYYA